MNEAEKKKALITLFDEMISTVIVEDVPCTDLTYLSMFDGEGNSHCYFAIPEDAEEFKAYFIDFLQKAKEGVK